MGDTTCETLRQRRSFIQMILPPVRFEGVQNPYLNTNYTQSQLDMRRKAEILQYNKNSTQTNKLTQSQQFAKAVGRNITAVRATSCINDLYVPSLSSSSDVPGPVITLRYDPTVPLYKYRSNTAPLGIVEIDDLNKFIVSTKDDIISYNSIETILVDIAITNIDTSSATFSINSPIGIYVDGSAIGDISGNVTIDRIDVSVFYNDVDYLLTSPVKPTTNFDVLNKTVTYNVTNPNTDSSIDFSGVKYIGNLNITNLTLPTMNGHVYNIKVKFKLNVTPQVGQPNILNTKVYMNVSTNSQINCSFTSPTSVPPQEPFSISSI